MKVTKLQEILDEIVAQNGADAVVFFETPRGTIVTPKEDEGWYDGDEDDDFPPNAAVIPVKVEG